MTQKAPREGATLPQGPMTTSYSYSTETNSSQEGFPRSQAVDLHGKWQTAVCYDTLWWHE
jgi:hypothetical protein